MEYKYKPEDFSKKNGLDEDLGAFYEAIENFDLNPKAERGNLMLQRDVIFFSIKHRTIEHYLTPAQKEELYDYLEELLVDRL